MSFSLFIRKFDQGPHWSILIVNTLTKQTWKMITWIKNKIMKSYQ